MGKWKDGRYRKPILRVGGWENGNDEDMEKHFCWWVCKWKSLKYWETFICVGNPEKLFILKNIINLKFMFFNF